MITSKNAPVYRVNIDSANFANFVNAIQNPDLSGDLYSCLGWGNNVGVTAEDAAKTISALPATYVEINSNNEFSRVYLESDVMDGAA